MKTINDGIVKNNHILKTLDKEYEVFEIENFKVTFFHFNKGIMKTKFYHKHLDYEFVVALTNIEGILFEGNKYIGEADTIYPISPNRMHGIDVDIDSKVSSYIDIYIDNKYFNSILNKMGYENNSEFNYEFSFNKKLALYLLRFSKIYKENNVFKNEILNNLKELICEELIELGLTENKDNRKRKNTKDEKFYNIANFIATNYNKSDIVKITADLNNYTVNSLEKLFQRYYKIPLHQFILKVKLSNAKMLLKYSILSINDIAKECGFKDGKYFSEIFIKKNKISPTQYRKDYKGTNENDEMGNNKSLQLTVNEEFLIYNEICCFKNELIYNNLKYSYFLIPLSLLKINEIVFMPKNIYYFEANQIIEMEKIKNTTFYVLAIKKEVIEMLINEYNIDVMDIPMISNTFFTYLQDIISRIKNDNANIVIDTLYELIKKEIIYSYLETSDLLYKELKEIIYEHINNDNIIEIICKQKNYNENEFTKRILKKFKVTPHEFLIHCRLLKAKELLANTNMNINKISDKSGFTSVNSFIYYMKKNNYLTPNEYREKFQKTRKP